MASPYRPTCLSLCSGIGGLELAAHRVFGARVLGYCEREAFPASGLLARMEDETLEPAPIWCGNLEDLDAGMFAGVDIVTAGFPCQPFSCAGARKGKEDERWIWPAIAEILRRVGPRIVFLENVPGLVQHGLGDVLGTLADLGLDATWDLFRASDVGAPHRRTRVFILGVSDTGRLGDSGDGFFPISQRREEGRGGARPTGEELGHADGAGLEERTCGEKTHEGRSEPSSGCERVADAHRRGPWPPGPRDADGWRAWIDAGGPQPAVRRGAHGIPDRLDRLRALGNAVVPDCAEMALRVLVERHQRGAVQVTREGRG